MRVGAIPQTAPLRPAILTRGDVITSWPLTKAIGAKNADLSMALHPLTALVFADRVSDLDAHGFLQQIISSRRSVRGKAFEEGDAFRFSGRKNSR
jgi:hypothetical protein